MEEESKHPTEKPEDSTLDQTEANSIAQSKVAAKNSEMDSSDGQTSPESVAITVNTEKSKVEEDKRDLGETFNIITQEESTKVTGGPETVINPQAEKEQVEEDEENDEESSTEKSDEDSAERDQTRTNNTVSESDASSYSQEIVPRRSTRSTRKNSVPAPAAATITPGPKKDHARRSRRSHRLTTNKNNGGTSKATVSRKKKKKKTVKRK